VVGVVWTFEMPDRRLGQYEIASIGYWPLNHVEPQATMGEIR